MAKSPGISTARRRIIEQLEVAARSASEVGCDRWQFAIELSALLHSGIDVTDLRALISAKSIQHGIETTTVTSKQRGFKSIASLSFPAGTCFVLCERQPLKAGKNPLNTNGEPPDEAPYWDRKTRTLYMNGRIVKKYLVPAPTQQMILSVFEEEGWPCTIDDPLPPVNGQSRKQRLHNSINALNRSHRITAIRFCGNGTGDGISWERCPDVKLRQGGYPARKSKLQSS